MCRRGRLGYSREASHRRDAAYSFFKVRCAVKALRLFVRALLVVGCFLSIGADAHAQATLTGRVVDAQGPPWPAPRSPCSGPAGPPRTGRSVADGTFTIASVPAGDLQLLVRAPGLRRVHADRASRCAGQRSRSQVAGLTDNVTVQGALIGTAATGKTNLPLRDIPMTVHGVPGRVIQEQAVNDLDRRAAERQRRQRLHAARHLRGLHVPRVPRPVPVAGRAARGRRAPGRQSPQLADDEHRARGSAEGAVVGALRRQRAGRHREPDSQEAVGRSRPTTSRRPRAAGASGAARSAPPARLKSDALLYRLDVGGESREGYRHNESPPRAGDAVGGVARDAEGSGERLLHVQPQQRSRAMPASRC